MPTSAASPPRLVQLGFLQKLGQFFGQAEARKDPSAQALLAHSAWHLSVTLTDVKPVAAPPVVTLRREDDVSVLSEVRLQQQQQYKGGHRRSSVKSIKSIYEGASSQGVTRGARYNRRRSSGGSSYAVSTTLSETNTATPAASSRAPASTGAVVARAPPVVDRPRLSIASSRKGTCTGAGQGGPLAARAARGPAEKGPGTATPTPNAAATAGKGAERRFGGGSSGVATEEGSTPRREPTTARILFDRSEATDYNKE